MLSGSYLKFESEPNVLNDAAAGSSFHADVTLRFTTWEAGFGYRLPTGGNPKSPVVELLGGARYTKIEATIQATSASSSFDKNESISWSDPFLGMRAMIPISKGFGAAVRADVGGFGLSQNQTKLQWNFVAGFGYNWKFSGWGIGAFGGYKINQYDYQNPDDPTRFSMNQRMAGPVISLTATF